MLSNKKLDLLRREIFRLAGNEVEAEGIALDLLATNWQKVMLSDKVKCNECQLEILYSNAFFIAREGKRPYCYNCTTIMYEKECLHCGDKIMVSLEDWQICSSCEEWSRNSFCRLDNCLLCNRLCSEEVGICQWCMAKRGLKETWVRREYVKVQTHNGRAIGLGLLGTLSLSGWAATLEDHNWLCAYCLTRPYENLDHFIPLCKGGNTSKANCIPSCRKCNDLKHQIHPDNVTAIPQSDIDRVRTFLSQF